MNRLSCWYHYPAALIILATLAPFSTSFAKQTLSERASNPITNLSQLQFESDVSPKNYGSNGISNNFTIKPLIAIDKPRTFPFEQLMRLKIQVPMLPDSALTTKGTSLGDTQFFDLFILEEPSWGRWGLGPMAIFPTATRLQAGQGKWMLGPALGMSILKFKGWQIGFLAQNPISFAGHRDLSKQNYLLFQPFIIYHFLKNSYVFSNAESTFDWINHVQQIPVNIGIGYTFAKKHGVHIDTSLQYQTMAYQNALKIEGYIPRHTIQLSLNFLLEE